MNKYETILKQFKGKVLSEADKILISNFKIKALKKEIRKERDKINQIQREFIQERNSECVHAD
jgi:hypothetical protein